MEEAVQTSPYGDLLGIEVLQEGEGVARCRVALQDCHRNNGGSVHGGLLTSLADTCAGMAVRSIRPPDMNSATTDLSIAFIRPPKGDVLEAEARVIHGGRRLVRLEISISCADVLVARSSATFMLLPNKE